MYMIILILPLISTIISGLFGNCLSRRGVALIACNSLLLTWLASVYIFYEVALLKTPCLVEIGSWFTSVNYTLKWGFLFDTLTAVMLIVVTSISTLVHIYSTEYMREDPHLPRFMAYLSFFTFFMLILVTGDNFIQMFVGWEGVGLSACLSLNYAGIGLFLLDTLTAVMLISVTSISILIQMYSTEYMQYSKAKYQFFWDFCLFIFFIVGVGFFFTKSLTEFISLAHILICGTYILTNSNLHYNFVKSFIFIIMYRLFWILTCLFLIIAISCGLNQIFILGATFISYLNNLDSLLVIREILIEFLYNFNYVYEYLDTNTDWLGKFNVLQTFWLEEWMDTSPNIHGGEPPCGSLYLWKTHWGGEDFTYAVYPGHEMLRVGLSEIHHTPVPKWLDNPILLAFLSLLGFEGQVFLALLLGDDLLQYIWESSRDTKHGVLEFIGESGKNFIELNPYDYFTFTSSSAETLCLDYADTDFFGQHLTKEINLIKGDSFTYTFWFAPEVIPSRPGEYIGRLTVNSKDFTGDLPLHPGGYFRILK